MCPHSRIAALGAAFVMACLPALAAGRAPEAVDPLLDRLQDGPASARVLELLREQGRPPCPALARYASDPRSRVRESAVRAMDAGACSTFEDYAGYLHDPAAGVVDAVIGAAERRRMAEAVPYLLGCLSDRRRIVTEQGNWSLADRAQRALMVLTCQSFHYEAGSSRDDRRNALTRWRQWYLAKRDLPRDEWVQEGIDRGLDYVARDYRLEGLRLLAFIGPPALPALRQALSRGKGDLEAEVVCLPEGPPRPPDAVPCALVVRNTAAHHVTIAPESLVPEISVSPLGTDGAYPQHPGTTPTRNAPSEILDRLADQFVDFGPAETRRYEFKVGPVTGAGRYQVRVRLRDLAAFLATPDEPVVGAIGGQTHGGVPMTSPRSATYPAIEAETVLRFDY